VLFLPVSRREFIKIGAAAAIGVGVASAIEIPIFESVISSKNSDIKSLQGQVTSTQQAFLTLSKPEQLELEAMVETIIPTDSNGPGAKEAGVIFFIDHQLANEYGNNGRMYMQGPFVTPGQAGPITVGSITYPGGSPAEPYAGPAYQYNLLMREFWRNGLSAVETYSNSAYGNNFENLTSTQQVQVLTDLYNNKPSTANFNNIIPLDFFSELIFMTWSGFLMDPVYGGNANMVGWTYTGFTGANEGDNFKEGRNVMMLMVASKPTRYPPHSLAEFQQAIGEM
jgi:gluconate 2-dehydrogenase gamma chain